MSAVVECPGLGDRNGFFVGKISMNLLMSIYKG